MRSVSLAHATDFDGFRDAARALLAAGVPPEDVGWHTPVESGSLFGDEPSGACDGDLDGGSAAPCFTVPRAYLELARRVVLHRDPRRFALLYRLLWRMRTEPRVLAVEVDADVALVRSWHKAVEHDIQKMHAHVRFRAVPHVASPAFVAWFEPEHRIVEAAAPFFVRRFANSAWAILTPERSARWDLHELRFGPGSKRADAPADDAAEALWRSYYASIFNPARLNVAALRGHLPKKYWRNLPESVLIPALIASAEARTRSMLDSAPTTPAKRRRPVERRAVDPGGGGSLEQLRRRAEHCRDCPLWESATQMVFGAGPASARVVLVGEQPGDREDLVGEPFVGPAGRLLDRALADAGVNRAEVYVTNAVKHFKFEPRGKRRIHSTPSSREVGACVRWLDGELDAIRPDLTVAMGATAARAVLGRAVPIQSTRGKVVRESGGGRRGDVLVTVHPSYLLRIPDAEKEAAYRQFVADLELATLYLGRASAVPVVATREADTNRR